MAQAGYTPISLYFSTTAAAVPTSVNLANGELAINIQDEKLYFKNAAGTVKLLASNATSAPVLSFSAGTTGLTPNTATTGAVTLAGTLAVANGGTGVTTSTGTTNVVLSNNPVLVAPTLGVATATSLQGIIGNVTPAAGSFTTLGASSTATLNTLSSSGATLTGGTINGMTVGATTASSGAFTTVTASTAIGTASGGTGLSSFTSGGVVYASSTSALATGSVFTFDGANAIINATTPAYFTGTSNLAQISINRSPSTGAIFNASQSAAFINIDGASGGSSVQFAVASAANTQPSEAMRLTSTGLGIGTSSPSSYATDARNLVIASSGNTGMTIKSGATSTGVISFANAENSTSNNGIVSFNHNDLSLNFNIYGTGRSYRFQSAGTEVMRLDSAGNLGLGVTPSAWEAGYQVFENSGGSFFSGSGSVVRTVQGGYINSGYKYKYTGVAAGLYAMSAGSHQWSTAASGTAGNAITFTQALTLSAAGNLIVGDTTGNGKLSVRDSSAALQEIYTTAGTNYAALEVRNTGGSFYIGRDNSAGSFFASNTAYASCLYSSGAYPMVFFTNGTERARIDSSGNVGIGTSSPTTQLEIKSAQFTDSQITLDNTSSNTTSRVLFKAAGTEYGRVSGDSTSVILQSGNIPIVFRTNSAERARIDSSGNVGIGTSSPSQKLEVSGTILAKTTSTPAIIARSTSTGMKVFYDDGRTEFTAVNYDGLSTVGAQDLFITSGQKATFGVNSNSSIIYPLEITTAGVLSIPYGQIQFPATQVASANANTLDDYEEGTWTPTLGGSGGTSGQTYSYRVGRYTKIGRQVICSFEAALSAAGTLTDYAVISGLPFTTTGTSTNLDAGGVLVTFASGLATNQIYVTGYLFNGTTEAWITGTAAAGTAIGNILATNIWGNSARISGTITYTAS